MTTRERAVRLGSRRLKVASAYAVAGWLLVGPPYTVEDDCTFRYRDLPQEEWSERLGPFGTSEECEAARVEVDRRLARSRERLARSIEGGYRRAPHTPWWDKRLFPPSSWDECQAKADYWELRHTACLERASRTRHRDGLAR